MNKETQRLMALSGIKEGDKKFLTNESFTERSNSTEMEDEKESDKFTIFELDQIDVEPGEDDEKLYKIG